MGYRNAAQFDVLRVVAAGSITSSYAIAGPVLPQMAVAVNFKNATDGIVYVSTDGINDMIAVPAGWGEVYDIRTNAPNTVDFLIAKGTPFLIKYSGSAPTTGSFYIEAVLAEINP
jgi:hypothetical protein